MRALEAYRKHRDSVGAKWPAKVARGAMGLALFAGLVLLIRADVNSESFSLPWAVYGVAFAVGGYLISRDLMIALKEFVVGLVKDLLAVLKGTP